GQPGERLSPRGRRRPRGGGVVPATSSSSGTGMPGLAGADLPGEAHPCAGPAGVRRRGGDEPAGGDPGPEAAGPRALAGGEGAGGGARGTSEHGLAPAGLDPAPTSG